MKILIIAGGSGSRLWPLSRDHFSKQCLTLFGQDSLIEHAYKRALALTSAEEVYIITNKNNVDCVRENLKKTSANLDNNLIIEPDSRNTAPAIALGVKQIMAQDKDDDVVVILPADHLINPVEKFVEYVKTGVAAAQQGPIVVFGIKPTRAETGYGYIETGRKTGKLLACNKFTEKPDKKTAEKYLKSGKHLWNSGMFAFTISTFIDALNSCTPEIANVFNQDLPVFLKGFSSLPDISIDYAIIEKAKNIAVVAMDLSWFDIGSWEAFFDVMPKDKEGNVQLGEVKTIQTKNSLIQSSRGRVVAAVGVDDLIIIDTSDALLVAKKGFGQEVKQLKEELKRENRKDLL